MARLAHLPVSDDDEYNGDGAQPSHQRDSRRVTGITSLSPSPAASFSSDKENHTSTTRTSRSVNVKAKSMLPPRTPGLDLDEGGTPRAAKRRKLGERGVPNASQAAHETELEKLGHSQYYDPNQSMEERRAVRKGIRDLSKELIGTLECSPWRTND